MFVMKKILHAFISSFLVIAMLVPCTTAFATSASDEKLQLEKTLKQLKVILMNMTQMS